MSQPDWEALKAFSLVARTGSLAGAAEALGCAVSTVSRRIEGLEQTLELTLLHRARAGAVPTDVGQTILTSIDQAAQSLDRIPRQARHYHHFRSRQNVRLSATETAINDILMPRIGKLRLVLPEVLVEFESSNSYSDLEYGRTDIAIRLLLPDKADLITRKLAPIGIAVFISSTQLGGRDASQIQFLDEPIVWIDSGLGDIAENRLIDQLGIRQNIALRATSVRALALACRHGQGLAMLPRYMGHDLGLIELPHLSVPDRQAWLVYHPETRRDPILKKVRNWIIECFAASVRQKM